MKVYIVTDGCYSDYTIQKVFSNLPAAEEYKKWHNITNDIEEYEIHDEPFGEYDGEKSMFIRVQGTVYPEAVVDIKYQIRPDMVNEDYKSTRGCGISDYQKSGVFTIYNYHYVPVDKWDEKKYKDKLTKALYNLAYIAKAMFMEGAAVYDVEQVFKERGEVGLV